MFEEEQVDPQGAEDQHLESQHIDSDDFPEFDIDSYDPTAPEEPDDDGMAARHPVSQNGYRANTRSLISSIAVPGGKLAVRTGDVAVIMAHIAQRFHRDVEKLEWPGNWGYAERPIRGGTSLSNHASGTAIDLNAPRHPLGASGTFRAAQVKEIRRILAECSAVVRWGGDYRSRKDEMHFEINASPDAVKKAAQKLRSRTSGSGPAPAAAPRPAPASAPSGGGLGAAPPFPWPADHWIGLESSNPRNHSGKLAADRPGIILWQKAMLRRGWKGLGSADGRYGPRSEKVARQFQAEKGLKADGYVGLQTWRATWSSPVT